MAITAANAVLVPTAATKTGQIVISGNSDVQENVYRGTAVLTLDGTLTAATINFIDGTQKIAFTPTFINVFRSLPVSGDTAAASIAATSATIVDDTKFTVTFSAAGSASQLATFGFVAYK